MRSNSCHGEGKGEKEHKCASLTFHLLVKRK